jgi:hypothetical protein
MMLLFVIAIQCPLDNAELGQFLDDRHLACSIQRLSHSKQQGLGKKKTDSESHENHRFVKSRMCKNSYEKLFAMQEE